jgi:hypothetical protein
MGKSETAIKELVKRKDVDVNLKNNQNQNGTPFDFSNEGYSN